MTDNFKGDIYFIRKSEEAYVTLVNNRKAWQIKIINLQTIVKKHNNTCNPIKS